MIYHAKVQKVVKNCRYLCDWCEQPWEISLFFLLRFQVHKYYNSDFDNNFAAIASEFLDATQFGNPGKNVTHLKFKRWIESCLWNLDMNGLVVYLMRVQQISFRFFLILLDSLYKQEKHSVRVCFRIFSGLPTIYLQTNSNWNFGTEVFEKRTLSQSLRWTYVFFLQYR